MLLDAHCHIDHYPNPLEVVRAAFDKDVFTLAVTNLPSHYQQARQHLGRENHVVPCLGAHPLLMPQHLDELPLFREICESGPIIGEVGLDRSRDGRATFEKQISVFRDVVDTAGPDALYSIHSRGAEQAVLDLLDSAHVKRCIFHWYSGPFSVLDAALERGHFFSINPQMCRSKKGRSIIERVPVTHILTETDGPFAGVDGKPYHPWNVIEVLEHLAQLHAMPVDEIRMLVWQNFLALVETCGISQGVLGSPR